MRPARREQRASKHKPLAARRALTAAAQSRKRTYDKLAEAPSSAWTTRMIKAVGGGIKFPKEGKRYRVIGEKSYWIGKVLEVRAARARGATGEWRRWTVILDVKGDRRMVACYRLVKL